MVRDRNDGEQGKRCGVAQQSWPESFLNMLFIGKCTTVSTGDAVFTGKAADLRKQVTLSTSGTPVNQGLRRNCYNMALLLQVALCSQTKRCCKELTRNKVSQRRLFAEDLDEEHSLPTAKSGQKSPDQEVGRTEDWWRGNHGRQTRAHSRESQSLNAVA